MRSATLLLLFVLVASPAEPATDRQTRVFAWSSSRSLAIELTIGEVRIVGSERSDVEVSVQRTAPTTEALERVPLVFEESTERVSARFVQGEGDTDPAFRTDVVLRVPVDAVIDRLRVVEGRLSVERFRGALAAEVRRGPIEGVDVAGALRLETGIGSVTLRNARLTSGGLLRLRAFNGDVRLSMPGAPPDARILALALNGRIQSDIALTTRDTWGPRWSEATLGRGEPVISIDVVTGTIEIRTR